MRLIRLYGRVLAMLGRDRRVVASLIGGNLIVAGMQFLDPMLFGRVIGLLTGAGEMTRGDFWQRAAMLLGAWVVIGGTGIAANVAVALHADRLAHRNRLAAMQACLTHALSLPAAFHGGAHSGRLMKLMLAGADAMFGLWLSLFRDQLATIVCALILLPLTLLMNWRLGLVLIVLTALFCVATLLVIGRTHVGQKRAQHWHVALAATAQDALANVSMLQAFGQLGGELGRFRDIAAKVITHQFDVLGWWALLVVLTRAASTVAVMVIVVMGALLNLNGQASVGEIVSFMGFATLLIARLDAAMQFIARLFFELPNIAEYFAVLDTRSSVPERQGAHALRPGPDGSVGAVTFEHVDFAYSTGTAVLSDVSFHAPPGSVVALVGHSGAGKSTALSLLLRLWDPQSGRVLIDGQDVRDLTLDSLRDAIGVVFQESMLLNRSIRDNVLVGNPDASEAELDAACALADAKEFIARQPEGLDTMVAERGASLSGGQRQRLAIARAALRNPPILVLDEATSALDAATEARVGRALKALMRGRTTFIIAHRLSTVRDADEILVFEEGRIVERGGFSALLAAGGRFADLVATQLAPAPPSLHMEKEEAAAE